MMVERPRIAANAVNAGRGNRLRSHAPVLWGKGAKSDEIADDPKTVYRPQGPQEPFWLELRSIAAERKLTLGELISMIDAGRKQPNLPSALRLFVLAKYRPDGRTS
jgi:hypothetical protein